MRGKRGLDRLRVEKRLLHQHVTHSEKLTRRGGLVLTIRWQVSWLGFTPEPAPFSSAFNVALPRLRQTMG